MTHLIWNTQRSIIGSALLGSMVWGTVTPKAIAQLSDCPPPQSGEYLILVIATEEKEQEAVINLLPLPSAVLICNYLGEVVVRVGGYGEIEEANTWAQSIAAQTGLGAFVTRPPQVTAELPIAPTPPIVEAEASGETSPPDSPTGQRSLPLPNVRVIPAQQVGTRPQTTERTITPEAAEVEEVKLPGELPENRLPENRLPENRLPENRLPENRLPENRLPENRLPENESRENETQEGYVPDLRLPSELTELPDYNVLPSVSVTEPPPYPVTPVYNPPPPLAIGYDSLPALPKPLYPSAGEGVDSLPVAYNPQPLDEGYAVLVDYFNEPEIAVQLQQVVGADVGLASYGQRPYLLVRYTDDEDQANSTLQTLSDNGFLAMVVDSRQVIVLSSVVASF